MFRKIVSNLSFSPALVGQLGFYAKRLRKEETTRRLGLIFTALALVVQSLAVFTPPEAANAASAADWVRGGVSSKTDFLRYYDRNSNNIKSIMNSLGITRAEISKTKPTVIGEASRYNWSMTSLYSHSQGQRSYKYDKAGGGKGTTFYRPMRLTQQGGDRHAVFAGYSKTQGWFAIKKDCGNLITGHPPVVKKPASSCKNLNVTKIDRTKFRFNAKAATKDGAKVKSYTYLVKNNKGKVVNKVVRNSSSLNNSATIKKTIPGRYTVTLTVQTTLGKRTNSDCRGSFTVKPVKPTPIAACEDLKANVVDATIVNLNGRASTDDGAKIKKYTFVVKDSSGKTVKTVPVSSTQKATATSFTLAKPGTYTVTLRVDTSVGVKTDSVDCVAKFTIAEPKMCPYNPQYPINSPECQPCPEEPEIWLKDEDCVANVISTKTTSNLTQGSVDATSKIARAGDKISYTLTVENTGIATDTVTMKEDLSDVLEYSRLVDRGAGTLDTDTNILTWADVELKPGEKQSRTIAVQLMSPIPATNTGTSNESSYDCRMTNTFGNSVGVNVECPVEKEIVEQVVTELPTTGPKENMMFAAGLLAVVVYFYTRSRQLGKEVRLVRHDLNTGSI